MSFWKHGDSGKEDDNAEVKPKNQILQTSLDSKPEDKEKLKAKEAKEGEKENINPKKETEETKNKEENNKGKLSPHQAFVEKYKVDNNSDTDKAAEKKKIDKKNDDGHGEAGNKEKDDGIPR